MTYKELKDFVNSLSDADMTKDVQVLLIDAGEFTSLDYAAFADENGRAGIWHALFNGLMKGFTTMATFRVLAEATQLFEIEIKAANEAEALEKAQEADFMDWHVMDETGQTDGFEIINSSIERA